MSDLTTNENQNENKYDLFKGVLLVNNNDVTQYGLIYMSEIEITAKSTINYEDAEKSLKNLASYLGFNCILNIVRDNYTDSMQTSGTMHTEGRVSSFSNSYSSTSTINTETKVNNNFRIKGTLAIVGKPNPNGVSVNINVILERANIVYECQSTTQPIYEANCALEKLDNKSKIALISSASLIVLCLIPMIGFGFAFVNIIIVAISYFSISKIRKIPYNTLQICEPNLKKMILQYGDEMITIYKLTSKTNIKYIGE
ncbi:hypothetical protein [Campylobacter sp. RM12637]|uniref:hypothetical protein n=1 Tax=Campylobacter sp. RM12637 TaxID=2735734 RepID=UPI0030147CAA|nr:hypothetical protein [Campylobacter sp. RM12637]